MSATVRTSEVGQQGKKSAPSAGTPMQVLGVVLGQQNGVPAQVESRVLGQQRSWPLVVKVKGPPVAGQQILVVPERMRCAVGQQKRVRAEPLPERSLSTKKLPAVEVGLGQQATFAVLG